MARISANDKAILDNTLARAVEEGNIPAAVFGVTNIDEEIYSGAAGTKVPSDPSSGNVDMDTNFWICSQTKLIVSIAVLQLVEKNKISLDTHVADILPELANPVILNDPSAVDSTYVQAKVPITLFHLLNHSSGLFYDVKHKDGSDGFITPYATSYENTLNKDPITQFFDFVKGDYPGVPLKFEPGTDFAYGQSVDAVGFIVERLTGKSLEEYCKENIFKPLGMKTSFYVTPEMKKNSLEIYYRRDDGKLELLTNQIPLGPRDYGKVHIHLGGIGLTSSMRDYLTLLRHLLQINAARASNPILSTETVKKLFYTYTLSDKGVISLNAMQQRTDIQWTLGLCANTVDWPGRRSKGSLYWGGWAETQYFLDPAKGIAAVYGVQILNAQGDDHAMLAHWSELETAVYNGLIADN